MLYRLSFIPVSAPWSAETARRITEDPASAIRSAQRQGMRRKAEASDAVEMSRQGAGGTGSRSSHPAAAQAGTNGHGNGATGSDESECRAGPCVYAARTPCHVGSVAALTLPRLSPRLQRRS